VDISGDDFFECIINRTIRADHTNIVTATVQDDEENKAARSADASVDVVGPAIRVTAEASVYTVVVGDVITYTYTVENAGDETLSNVVAHDDRLGPISLGSTTLALGQVTTGNAAYLVSMSDPLGPIVNTVLVTGTSPAEVVVTNVDTVEIEVVRRIYLPITLRADGSAQ
jgi:hypothetical protein